MGDENIGGAEIRLYDAYGFRATLHLSLFFRFVGRTIYVWLSNKALQCFPSFPLLPFFVPFPRKPSLHLVPIPIPTIPYRRSSALTALFYSGRDYGTRGPDGVIRR